MLDTYFKQLAGDYISSGRDTLQLIRQNPVPSTLWTSAVLALSYITSTCPNKQNYYDSLVESAIDLWEVPDLIRNSGSASYIHKCLKLFSKEQIRYNNLGLFAIIWQICKYTYPANGGGNFTGLLRLFLFDRPQENGLERIQNIVQDRILDFGFMGKWWFMSHYMDSYDINPDEWETPKIFEKLTRKESD
ncbi:unnamed protein product [Schistosoma mattheei]|uniref:Uncharacterized protein n=1 Tax=Schistosoma mattheei TaxID=31246 RepID=A0A3P7ZZG4_9TREM|nr:unnamed protein product [Schistosoma mattheei]